MYLDALLVTAIGLAVFDETADAVSPLDAICAVIGTEADDLDVILAVDFEGGTTGCRDGYDTSIAGLGSVGVGNETDGIGGGAAVAGLHHPR